MLLLTHISVKNESWIGTAGILTRLTFNWLQPNCLLLLLFLLFPFNGHKNIYVLIYTFMFCRFVRVFLESRVNFFFWSNTISVKHISISKVVVITIIFVYIGSIILYIFNSVYLFALVQIWLLQILKGSTYKLHIICFVRQKYTLFSRNFHHVCRFYFANSIIIKQFRINQFQCSWTDTSIRKKWKPRRFH